MERNVGSVDSAVRIAIGILALTAGVLTLDGYWTAGALVGGLAVAVGAIMVLTGTARTCPIYKGVGIDTVRKR